ncbi:hypothetical protein ACE1MS_08500 [Lysinibacillus sp. fkY74-1]|uniref:hypothetical protein n=1 Tax=Lysinibacillus TaxID=400634 RepID=UPI000B0CC23F|nr:MULTISPECIES: hypothetical protein [Lysinibacillus]MDR0157606.1 hypothetical protein [Lysinibacillus sphaericus]
MEKMVLFYYYIEFTNRGGIQGQKFRLGIEGDDISEVSPIYCRGYEIANGW